MEKNTSTKMGKIKKIIKQDYIGWLCASPVILGLLIFTFWPLVSSFYYSLTKNDFFNPVEFIGFQNYIDIFTVDFEKTTQALGLTVLYAVVAVPFNLILSYLLAVFLNAKMKGVYVMRVLCYLPCVIPGVVGGLIWRDMLNPNYGIVNEIFAMFGLPRSEFFYGQDSAFPTLIFTSFFNLGGGMIMWLAQLKAIPPELYEAADIDGCNAFGAFFAITIPMSTPMIFYNLVTQVIGSLQIFSSIVIMTGVEGGGANDSLLFFVGLIYRSAFKELNMGYASALSWVLFVVIGLLSILMFKTSKWVNYADGGED